MCCSEIRLLQQRSGLAGYRAFPDPLTPLAGNRVGQGTQGGSIEGPKEKERVVKHSTGRLLQDTPVQSFPTNAANRKPIAKHGPRCQDTEANEFSRKVNEARRNYGNGSL